MSEFADLISAEVSKIFAYITNRTVTFIVPRRVAELGKLECIGGI